MTREELREKSELASSVELLRSIPGSSADFADNAKLRDELDSLQNTYRQLKVKLYSSVEDSVRLSDCCARSANSFSG